MPIIPSFLRSLVALLFVSGVHRWTSCASATVDIWALSVYVHGITFYLTSFGPRGDYSEIHCILPTSILFILPCHIPLNHCYLLTFQWTFGCFFSSGLLWMKLLWTFLNKSFFMNHDVISLRQLRCLKCLDVRTGMDVADPGHTSGSAHSLPGPHHGVLASQNCRCFILRFIFIFEAVSHCMFLAVIEPTL